MPDTVIDLLQNVAYIGCTYSLSRARREGELIPAQWSPIVGRDLFEQAQAVLRRNRRVSRGSVRPHYAFSRLLVCGECGRPLRASTNYGLSYYACRRDLAPEARCPATRRGAREDGLLAWADALFQRLDALAPEGFSEAVAGALSQPQQSPEALAQSDTTMDRLRKLYLWQHVSEPEYQRERERLEVLRADLAASTKVAAPVIPLAGIGSAWRAAAPTTRREMLAALFEGLIVIEGEITDFVPRPERAAVVVGLLQAVNEADFAKCGKGGVWFHHIVHRCRRT